LKVAETNRNKRTFKISSESIFNNNVLILIIIFGIILVIGGILVPNIFKLMNILNVLRIVWYEPL
jgi:hypothetical protein